MITIAQSRHFKVVETHRPLIEVSSATHSSGIVAPKKKSRSIRSVTSEHLSNRNFSSQPQQHDYSKINNSNNLQPEKNSVGVSSFRSVSMNHGGNNNFGSNLLITGDSQQYLQTYPNQMVAVEVRREGGGGTRHSMYRRSSSIQQSSFANRPLSRGSSSRHSSESLKMNWEPNESQNCTVCTSTFSVFKRKHHCRKCGK
jgi:hypothetical protein